MTKKAKTKSPTPTQVLILLTYILSVAASVAGGELGEAAGSVLEGCRYLLEHPAGAPDIDVRNPRKTGQLTWSWVRATVTSWLALGEDTLALDGNRLAGGMPINDDQRMALSTTDAPAKAVVHPLVRRGLLLALLIALLLGAGYSLGYRVNLQTRSIPVPTAQTTPDEVVLAYTEAYNRRDFDTMKTIYPSGQNAFSRFRAMGTMQNVRIIQSRTATDTDLSGTFPEAGHSYYRVEVWLNYTGLTGSDLAYDSGPNGWTYWLERPDSTQPWTITAHGNG